MREDGGYEVPPGSSIIEMIWAELDASFAEFMEGLPEDSGVSRDDLQQLRGRCAGLAAAIAIIRNPYDPDDDIIRAEAAERYAS